MRVDFSLIKELHAEFLKVYENGYIENIRKLIKFGKLEEMSTNLIKDVFNTYYRTSFFLFSLILRNMWFYKDFFLVLKKINEDIELFIFLFNFLVERKIAKIKNGEIIFSEEFEKFFLKPMTEEEILKKLKKKLKRINLKKSILENFGLKYSWKEKYDQIPITLESGIFLASKITNYYPFKEKFIFIGADDFIYLILSLINPEFSCKVIDIDENLLSIVERLKEKYNLNIEIEKVDIRKGIIGEKFYGSYLNPPYNYFGALAFLRYSSILMEKDGGICFLVLGEEAIGTRKLYLQEKLSKMGFRFVEITSPRISYLCQNIFKEDLIFREKLKRVGIDLENKEYLTASLFVLEKLPFYPKRIKLKRNIYFYI
ncbi:MAG: bis-aminopropyl spermidine synthase family protein [Candidatus Aenigmatarchaeota archaeon]